MEKKMDPRDIWEFGHMGALYRNHRDSIGCIGFSDVALNHGEPSGKERVQ